MGAHTKELNYSNFDATIAKGNTVVDFWAIWCGPCKVISPIVEQVAGELTGKVTFGKVNVDVEYELAERFGVMSIPTLIFFKNGEIVERVAGALPKNELLKRVKEAF